MQSEIRYCIGVMLFFSEAAKEFCTCWSHGLWPPAFMTEWAACEIPCFPLVPTLSQALRCHPLAVPPGLAHRRPLLWMNQEG